MATFAYEAKKDPSNVIKGNIIAESKSAAIQKIGQMGYYLVSIEEEGKAQDAASAAGRYFLNRVGLKALSKFTRQLADLLESGLTIVRALDILHNQSDNRRLKVIIADIRDHCIGGNPLSEALARHPEIFSPLYINMVKSGETGGALENILNRLSDLHEKQLEVRTKIRTALAYPILMSIVGSATIIVLLTFVIPKMTVIFSDLGQALPIPTQILLGISNAIRFYWWIFLAFSIMLWGVFSRMYATKEGRLAVDSFKLNLPVAGQLIKKTEIARFARTLATLFNSGVPILDSLRIVSNTMGNAVIRQEFENIYSAIRDGSSFAKSLYASKVMPLGVVNMIAVGEEGGHLERSLLKIAETYERESDEAVKIMMSLLEPILILTLGIVVGFIVVSMLLPIFEINFLMK